MVLELYKVYIYIYININIFNLMEISVMHTQEVYEHFIVSMVLNKKILGEIARDSF